MKFKKLGAVLGAKGILCIAALTIVALALVSYTSTVTITPVKQLTLGATTDDWTIYVNDVDQERYLPGEGTPAGSTVPATAPDGGSDTYAFNVTTDVGRSCAVNITLTSPLTNLQNFSKFQITVMFWNTTPSPATWEAVTIYNAPTGGSEKSYIDGLTGDFGYIRQSAGTATRYYLIKVTYSYDLEDSETPISVSFNYTPLPQA